MICSICGGRDAHAQGCIFQRPFQYISTDADMPKVHMITNVSIEAIQDLERRVEALERWKADTIARELRRAARRAQPPDVYDEMPDDPYERED